jgi:hypothetical protein
LSDGSLQPEELLKIFLAQMLPAALLLASARPAAPPSLSSA